MDAGKILLAVFGFLLLVLAAIDERRKTYVPAALAVTAFLWAGPLKVTKAACSFTFPLIWKAVCFAWGLTDAGLYRVFSVRLWELLLILLAVYAVFYKSLLYLCWRFTERLKQWRSWDYLFKSQEVRWKREEEYQEEICRGAEGPQEDDWAVLGLEPGASPAEVKAAYRRLVKEHHPDRGGDPEKFRKVHAAYKAVSKGVA